MVNPDFWRGKKVFVTGHTGFKGSWLSLWLERLGATVTGYSLPPPTKPSLYNLAKVGMNIASIEGDIRNYDALKSAMSSAKPEIVFHLAAQPLVRLSYREPVETYATNVMGTVHCLEAVRYTPSVAAAVIITTDKCYENREWVWGYREDEPMGGHDPYSNSKGCAELVASAYRRSFFGTQSSPKIATARAGNVIGGGDFAEDRLIPDIVKSLIEKEMLVVRNPNAIRPWQHVLEPLSGYLVLAERLYAADGQKFAEGWNFGPNDSDSWSVSQIVEHLFAIWARTGVHVQFGSPSDFHEANWLKLDISKARQRLEWHPILTISDALTITGKWYQQYSEQRDSRQQTLDQIHEYECLASIGRKPWSPI